MVFTNGYFAISCPHKNSSQLREYCHILATSVTLFTRLLLPLYHNTMKKIKFELIKPLLRFACPNATDKKLEIIVLGSIYIH